MTMQDPNKFFAGCINPTTAKARYVKLLIGAMGEGKEGERAAITENFLMLLGTFDGKKFHDVSGEGKKYEYTYKLNPAIESGWQDIVLQIAEIVGNDAELHIKRDWLWIETVTANKRLDPAKTEKLFALKCRYNHKRRNETGIDILIFEAEGARKAKGSRASYWDLKEKSFVSAGGRI